MAKEPVATFSKGMLTATIPVDASAGSISKSGKSFVLGGATIRDIDIGGEMVRVSISAYIPLKQPKKAAKVDDKVRMTLAEARKAAAKAAAAADDE